MSDVHSKTVRSYNMSMVKAKNTKPEMIVRMFLHARGFRYRLHVRSLPGKPDIILPKYKVAIQVQGCFWHGHDGCRYFVVPKTRTDWWMSKIQSNKHNDMKATKALEDSGWRVIVIWECEIKPKFREKTLDGLVPQIKMIS